MKHATLEIACTTPMPVGNITFGLSGELIYSNHHAFKPKYSVERWNTQLGSPAPFPNEQWNTPTDKDDWFFSGVLGLRNDQEDRVWMLDMAVYHDITQKIVGWNLKTNQLDKIYYLPKITFNKHCQPNDFVVDHKHGVFIIADEGAANGGDGSTGALLVVDMTTHKTKRLLQGHYSTKAEDIPIVIDGDITLQHANGALVKIGNDGITADKDFEWLYYGPINGHKLYRIRIEDLINESLSEAELGSKVEYYSEKPNNGGLSIDEAGNIYTTGIEDRSVYVILAEDRSLHQYCTDERLIWPDGVSYNHHDGYMYVSASQIYLSPGAHDGVDKSIKPYYTFKFKPIVPGVPYR